MCTWIIILNLAINCGCEGQKVHKPIGDQGSMEASKGNMALKVIR